MLDHLEQDSEGLVRIGTMGELTNYFSCKHSVNICQKETLTFI